MKAIFINSVEQTINEINFTGDYRDIQKMLDVELFTCVGLENGDTIYVDDMGLLNGTEDFFVHEDYHHPLAGNGLILGTDHMGDSCDCKSDVGEINSKVRFTNRTTIHLVHSLMN
jgi:hypothetical protein